MISMATIEELYEQNHTLALFCASCERWGTADLAALIRAGQGSRSVVSARFRCRDCGGTVDKQLRPPVPDATAASPYIQPQSAG